MREPKKKRASSSIKREADDRKSEIEGKFHSLADQNSSIHSTNFEIVVKLNQPFFFLKKIKLLIKASGWMATPNKKIQFQQQQQQQQPKIRNTKIKWP